MTNFLSVTAIVRKPLSVDSEIIGVKRKALGNWPSRIETPKRGSVIWSFTEETASDTGYSFPKVRLKPRISLKADVSSGDNPKSRNLGTLSPIYPIGNYVGVLADTGPGPVNFIDFHPQIQAQLSRSVTLSSDLVVQRRESLLDGVYPVPGFLQRAANGSQARFVGYRPGIEVRWQMDRHAYLQADYGVFHAGAFLGETMPGRNINYFSLWAGFKF